MRSSSAEQPRSDHTKKETTMSEPEPKPERKSLWSNPAELFRGIGTLVGGAAALLTALYTMGVIGPRSAESTPLPVATLTLALTAEVVATETLVPTAVPADTVLLEDNFSDASSGWEIQTDSDVDIGYQGGEYRIAVHTADTLAWGRHLQPHDWTDVVIKVDARWVEGHVDNHYGIQVRYQPDGQSYYAFLVSSLGMYSVWKAVDDEWTELAVWSESGALRQGAAANHLRIECRGREMRFVANDELLTVIQDDTFSSGSIGLLVQTFEEGTATVHFDNLLIQPLAEP